MSRAKRRRRKPEARRRRAASHRAGESSEGFIVCPVVSGGVDLFKVVPDCGDCSYCLEPFRPSSVFCVRFECSNLTLKYLSE